MPIAITGDLDWVGDLILYLEALDGGPAADVAGYAFTSSGDIEYSCSVSEPVDPGDRLLGLYRCVAKTAGGVIAGVGYVTVSAGATAVFLRSERASELSPTVLTMISDLPTNAELAAALSGSNLIGPGADACTMNIKIGGINQDNVAVWISTDSLGADIVAGTLYTNGSGNVTFRLTAGSSYYLWAEKSGINAIQGQQFVAEAD